MDAAYTRMFTVLFYLTITYQKLVIMMTLLTKGTKDKCKKLQILDNIPKLLLMLFWHNQLL